jgi:hypothetical protein
MRVEALQLVQRMFAASPAAAAENVTDGLPSH